MPFTKKIISYLYPLTNETLEQVRTEAELLGYEFIMYQPKEGCVMMIKSEV